jgi:MATE family multidrug resistance protein
LSLGIPSAMMLCLEWWAFEVMTLLAGYIGVDEMAAQVIIMNVLALVFMIAVGLQQAATCLIGQQIGN